MKNKARLLFITLIVLFAIICMPAKSQTYIPIPLDSAMWKVYYWVSRPYPFPPCECYGVTFTAGDTIINSQNYTLIKKLFSPACHDCIGRVYDPIQNAAIRQDSIAKKIYVIRLPDSLTERVLYDFSQNVGDTCNSILYQDQTMCGPLIISSIDSVKINNIYHRRINLSGGCLYFGSHSFIEGIGSTMGPLELLIYFESGSDLVCAHQYNTADLTIFPNSAYTCDTSSVGITENKTENYELEVFPNPFDFIINFEYVFPIKNIHIYNLLGQEIYYLANGGKQKVQLSRKEFAKGLYLYRVETSDERVFTGKLVAE